MYSDWYWVVIPLMSLPICILNLFLYVFVFFLYKCQFMCFFFFFFSIRLQIFLPVSLLVLRIPLSIQRAVQQLSIDYIMAFYTGNFLWININHICWASTCIFHGSRFQSNKKMHWIRDCKLIRAMALYPFKNVLANFTVFFYSLPYFASHSVWKQIYLFVLFFLP